VKFYLVRDIPDDVWVAVKRRAAKGGRSLRWVIIELLKFYAKKGLPGD
jgi:plasmid stability protein